MRKASRKKCTTPIKQLNRISSVEITLESHVICMCRLKDLHSIYIYIYIGIGLTKIPKILQLQGNPGTSIPRRSKGNRWVNQLFTSQNEAGEARPCKMTRAPPPHTYIFSMLHQLFQLLPCKTAAFWKTQHRLVEVEGVVLEP